MKKLQIGYSRLALCSLASVLALFWLGCAGDVETATQPSSATDSHADDGHVHGEWWCAEHGVPEEECTRCKSDLIPEYKGKGDWCDEHLRPDSHCFVCHPEYEAKYAERYEAKYGEKPPKPDGA